MGEIEVTKGHVLAPQGKFRQSPYLQETALFLGQGQVYEESSQLLTRLCKVNLSGKQIENLCHHYGEKLEELVEEQVISTKKESDLHYVMVDGSYIMSVRIVGLRQKWAGYLNKRQTTIQFVKQSFYKFLFV